jgi:hypothetical protein
MVHSILEAAAPYILRYAEADEETQDRVYGLIWTLGHGNFRVSEREAMCREIRELLDL